MNIKKILESNGLHEARVLSACDYMSVPKSWHFLLKEDSKVLRKYSYWIIGSLLAFFSLRR